MKRTKKPVIPGKMTHLQPKTPKELMDAIDLVNARGWRPSPEQELAEYFKSVEKLCGKSPKPGTALAEIRDAAEALRRAIDSGNPYLIAVRALELGEYRFWPGAVKHDAQTGAGRQNFAEANAGSRTAADELVISAFRKWQRAVSGELRRKGAITAKKRAELFAKYSIWKPRGTQRRRLFKLATEGKLPDLPV